MLFNVVKLIVFVVIDKLVVGIFWGMIKLNMFFLFVELFFVELLFVVELLL